MSICTQGIEFKPGQLVEPEQPESIVITIIIAASAVVVVLVVAVVIIFVCRRSPSGGGEMHFIPLLKLYKTVIRAYKYLRF